MTRKTYLIGLALTALALSGGVTGAQPQPKPTDTPAPPSAPILPAGYLPAGATPSSLTLVPPPPLPGSPAQARDDAAAQAAVALHGGPRWIQATEDAELRSPQAVEAFSCAIGVPITEAATPRLYVLLRRTLLDIGRSTSPTKIKYQRPRPFMVNGAPMCTPAVEDALRKDGSYPSGHSAIGWGWALILAQVAPERADPILARGRAFAQSRVVCNVHWLSDTEEGRMMGSATVARLQSEVEFRTDVEAARAEVAAARAKGLTPTRDCAKEAAQLAVG